MSALMRLSERIEVDDEYDEEKYRKELDDLKEEQEVTQKRIDYLEAYVNSEHNVRVDLCLIARYYAMLCHPQNVTDVVASSECDR